MRLDPKSSDYKRFIAKITFGGDNECWNWTGYVRPNGYGGGFTSNETRPGTHRVAYETWVGEIPDGMIVRHTCDNRLCCNPRHLLAGTHQDNVDDMVERGRQSRGEKNANAKITAEIAQQIYDEYATSGKTKEQIGEEFGVSQPTVKSIWAGRNWVHSINRWAHR